jgi:hypothetical protein
VQRVVTTIQFYINITTLSPIIKDDIMKALKKEFPQSFIKMWSIEERVI